MTNKELKLLYDKCNQLYFNNELNNKIEVKFSERMTSSAGSYRRKMNRYTGVIVSEVITLSSPYHRKYENEIMQTLVHEMIHAKYPSDGHGYLFLMEMNKINREYNLGIREHSSGVAVVNFQYICADCGNAYDRTRAMKNYHLYKCKCGGKLDEKRVN